ncbi:MAG: T9SS type A sorting domain-containing protein, partial [Flavobacteriales bacterium]|nr:T9SS type A sorting domain-containing protein [Flavobacteriales bacterium]
PTTSRVLNWFTLPLQDGLTYDVDVRASYDNGANYCPWGPVCQVTIANPPAAFSGRDSEVSPVAFDLFPNPSNGEQVRLTIDALPEALDMIEVDVYDAFGKQVQALRIPTQGNSVNALLNLEGLPTGMYTVQATANAEVFTRRLIVTR